MLINKLKLTKTNRLDFLNSESYDVYVYVKRFSTRLPLILAFYFCFGRIYFCFMFSLSDSIFRKLILYLFLSKETVFLRLARQNAKKIRFHVIQVFHLIGRLILWYITFKLALTTVLPAFIFSILIEPHTNAMC